MALFERDDESSKLVLCNICNVKCAERSIMTHKAKCQTKPNHKTKFEKGELEKCPYDFNHIVVGGQMDLHLEFCTKYQRKLADECRHIFDTVANSSVEASREQPSVSDDRNKEAGSESIVREMAKLDI